MTFGYERYDGQNAQHDSNTDPGYYDQTEIDQPAITAESTESDYADGLPSSNQSAEWPAVALAEQVERYAAADYVPGVEDQSVIRANYSAIRWLGTNGSTAFIKEFFNAPLPTETVTAPLEEGEVKELVVSQLANLPAHVLATSSAIRATGELADLASAFNGLSVVAGTSHVLAMGEAAPRLAGQFAIQNNQGVPDVRHLRVDASGIPLEETHSRHNLPDGTIQLVHKDGHSRYLVVPYSNGTEGQVRVDHQTVQYLEPGTAAYFNELRTDMVIHRTVLSGVLEHAGLSGDMGTIVNPVKTYRDIQSALDRILTTTEDPSFLDNLPTELRTRLYDSVADIWNATVPARLFNPRTGVAEAQGLAKYASPTRTFFNALLERTPRERIPRNWSSGR